MNPPDTGFAFGIRTQKDETGTIVGYQVQSENRGLPDEIVMTIVRNWLRTMEENYYKKFTGQNV